MCALAGVAGVASSICARFALSAPPLALVELPHEVIVLIARAMPYVDRLHLRATCRWMRAVLVQGGVFNTFGPVDALDALARIQGQGSAVANDALSGAMVRSVVAVAEGHLRALDLSLPYVNPPSFWASTPMSLLANLVSLRLTSDAHVWLRDGDLPALECLDLSGATMFCDRPPALLAFLLAHPRLRELRLGCRDEQQVEQLHIWRHHLAFTGRCAAVRAATAHTRRARLRKLCHGTRRFGRRECASDACGVTAVLLFGRPFGRAAGTVRGVQLALCVSLGAAFVSRPPADADAAY